MNTKDFEKTKSEEKIDCFEGLLVLFLMEELRRFVLKLEKERKSLLLYKYL